VRDTRVFDIVDERPIRLFVVRLERLDSLLRDALHPLLLLLLGDLVEVKHQAPETRDAVPRRAVDRDDLASVVTNDGELPDVLGRCTPLAVEALLALELLGDARIAKCGLPETAEVRAVRGKEGAMGEGFGHLRAEKVLFVEEMERLELD
jgi:hypothetical protein